MNNRRLVTVGTLSPGLICALASFLLFFSSCHFETSAIEGRECLGDSDCPTGFECNQGSCQPAIVEAEGDLLDELLDEVFEEVTDELQEDIEEVTDELQEDIDEADFVEEPTLLVEDLSAVGRNGLVILTWTNPTDDALDLCALYRLDGETPPEDRELGELIEEFTLALPGEEEVFEDEAVVNEQTYSYTIFCADLDQYWDETVTEGNTATATPRLIIPANPGDLVASNGEDSQSAISFTMPAPPVDVCALFRDEADFPARAGFPVTTFTGTGAQQHTDSGLTNDQLYYYAVYCHFEGNWNSTLDAGNSATATPNGPRRVVVTSYPATSLAAGEAFVVVAQIHRDGALLLDEDGQASIALGYNPAAGTLSGTLEVTVSEGVATFAGLSIDKAGPDYTLLVAYQDLDPASTGAIEIVPAAAAASTTLIIADPTQIVANGLTTSQITVQVRDAFLNELEDCEATVTLSSTLGNLGDVTNNGDGTFAAVLESGLIVGTATISGTLDGDAIGNQAQVHFTPVITCEDNPCLNGASCTDTAGGYRCDCLAGYWGTDCEELCPLGNCIGDVTCAQNNGEMSSCTECAAGFYDDDCEGVCADENLDCTTFACDMNGSNVVCTSCHDGYYGDDCDSSCESSITNCEVCTFNGLTCLSCQEGFYDDDCEGVCADETLDCATFACDMSGSSVVCTSCHDGHYGDDCDISCESSIPYCEVCTFDGMACLSCQDGYYGANCVACPASECTQTLSCQTETCGGVDYYCTNLGGIWAFRVGVECDDDDLCTYDDLCTLSGCEGTLIECETTTCATRECNGTDTCTETFALDTVSCGTNECPPNFCTGDTIWNQYPATCTNYCDGEGVCDDGCSCGLPSTTDCEASGCCEAFCDDNAMTLPYGCYTAAGACPDLCEAVRLNVDRECSGCGANGVEGVCSNDTVYECNEESSCLVAECGGVSYECRKVGGDWQWTNDLCQATHYCQSGLCIAPIGSCCDANTEPDICEEGSYCMDLVVEDTCMATPGWPNCWSDEDCNSTGTERCQGATVCSCLQDCISQIGLCQFENTTCLANDGQCIDVSLACPVGYVRANYLSCGVDLRCCLPEDMFYYPRVEVTGPEPVPGELTSVVATHANDTPQPTTTVEGRLTAVGALQPGNQEGCLPYTLATSEPFIALVQRGTCFFTEKITHAANAGAVAIIIYNNQVQGAFMNATGTIPAVFIPQAPGDAMYEFASTNRVATTVTIHPF